MGILNEFFALGLYIGFLHAAFVCGLLYGEFCGGLCRVLCMGIFI